MNEAVDWTKETTKSKSGHVIPMAVKHKGDVYHYTGKHGTSTKTNNTTHEYGNESGDRVWRRVDGKILSEGFVKRLSPGNKNYTTRAAVKHTPALDKDTENKLKAIDNSFNKNTKEDLDVYEQVLLSLSNAAEELGEDLDSETLEILAEEVLNELSRCNATDYTRKGHTEKTTRKVTKESVVSGAVEKFVIGKLQEDGRPVNKEELFSDRISHLSEANIDSLVDLYMALDEGNQYALVDMVANEEGIKEALDFIISNNVKGEN